MKIVHEEVFGPVMIIIRVPNDDDDEAARLVNSSTFGLGSSVFSRNQPRADALGQRIRAGLTNVNDFGVNYLVQSLPFGGVGESGFGRFAGAEGLRSCCLQKSVVTDLIPGIRTYIPSQLQYPDCRHAGANFAFSLIRAFYASTVWDRVKGLVGLARS